MDESFRQIDCSGNAQKHCDPSVILKLSPAPPARANHGFALPLALTTSSLLLLSSLSLQTLAFTISSGAPSMENRLSR